LPAFVLVGLVTPGNSMAFLAAAVPLAGSAAGALLVLRLGRADRDDDDDSEYDNDDDHAHDDGRRDYRDDKHEQVTASVDKQTV